MKDHTEGMAWRLASVGKYLALALLAVNGLTAQDRPGSVQIPEVHGTAFSNEAVNLPAALQGRVGVLVLGFSKASSAGATAWRKRLALDYRDSTTVVYYTMPVLASVPSMVRGMVIHSIKSSVPPEERARFVPVLDHETEWRALVHYGAPDDTYLVVVDGRGDVAWQTHGAATDAAYAALKQEVEALKTRVSR
jgi:hypothetical protein